MTEAQTSLSRWALLTIAGFTFGGAYFALQGIRSGGQWWLLPVLLLLLVLTVFLARPSRARGRELAVAVLFTLATLITLNIQQHAAMLYVVVCLLAIETLAKSRALIAVGASVLAVFASELAPGPTVINLQDAFVNCLLMVFLSGFALQRKEAEKRRRNARQLLLELEHKNRQLAIYATERERQSRMEERQQLSRDLHDTLGHKLTAAIVQLEAAERFLARDPARVKAILTTLRSLLRDGLQETRAIVHQLDETETGQQPLANLISTLVDSFKRTSGILVSLEFDGDEGRIPDHVKQHLFRIVQESLTNISRHANASSAHISLTIASNIELRVEDDGVGLRIQPGEALPPVKSIESRVAEMQGQLRFTREGKVTRVLVELPLAHSGVEHAN